MDDLVGRTLGQYRIIEQLGKGGMATVYRAFQPSLERYVAIKVLMPYFAHEEGFGQRFVREAKAIARLDHPHILPIYDYGQEGEIHYIVMKCVDAGTLTDIEAEGPLSLEWSVGIVSQIADALDHAHEQGVIHRDIKPSNVLMDRGEWVLLTDFGLAKMVEGSQQLTASGVGVGTPAYMPPEQGRGQPIDRQADVYSLGIVLYEMLTGCVPYEAETPLAVVLKHITDPLPLPRTINPNIPEAVELVILKALAKDPQDRYQSAGEMAAALCLAVECAEPADAVDVPSESLPPVTPPVPSAQESETESRVVVLEPEIPDEGSRSRSSSPGTEPHVQGGPAVSKRPVSWIYVIVAAVVLTLIAGGIWLALGGWPRRIVRIPSPIESGERTQSPAPQVAQPTLSSQELDTDLRIALSVRPDTLAETDVRRLEEFLSGRTGLAVQGFAVDSREALLELLRARDVEFVHLSMAEYLWLRDDEGIPLEPVLYVSPVFSGIIVVRAEGEVQQVGDLRGRPVALSSWDDPAGILGRAAAMERGLDVEQECEIVYVAPSADPQASVESLALLSDGRVSAAIVSNLALEKAIEGAQASGDRLRVLAESPPTSIGVVAVRPDSPADRVAALRDALLDPDPGVFRPGMFLGRLIPIEHPLAENMSDALHRTGLTAWQVAEGIAPEWQPPPEQPPRSSMAGDFRIAFVPAAGMPVEGRQLAIPILESLQRASQDLALELVVGETPEDGQPGDVTRDLIDQGHNLIVAVGWRDPDVFWGLARDHADARFVYFGHLYEEELPNLIAFAYQREQAGFLAGALAGRATETRRVAVIGGVPVPSVEQLVSGFERGVRYACPECETVVRFTDSFDDPALGERTGQQVVEEGADVLLNAAGPSGSAAIRNAAQQGAWVIGGDVDELLLTFRDGQVPGADHLMGSVVIHADRKAYEIMERLVHDEFEPGNFALGVAQGDIEFLPSPESVHPRWPELEQHIQEITDGLRRGEIRP